MKDKSPKKTGAQPSAKQIAANQLNSQKSTGPKSVEGKAKSSMNAIRHGFYSRATLLPSEDPEAYEELKDQIWSDLQPQNGLEAIYVREIVDCTWRLQRLSLVEVSVLFCQSHSFSGKQNGLGFAFLNDAQGSNAISKLSTCEASITRRLHRSMEQLRKLREKGWHQPFSSDSEPTSIPVKPSQGSGSETNLLDSSKDESDPITNDESKCSQDWIGQAQEDADPQNGASNSGDDGTILPEGAAGQ